MSQKISRRDLLGKGATLGAMAATPAFIRSAEARGKQDIRWTDEADVVVLGSGLAGCAAAVEAHDTDPEAKILMIEKMPKKYEGGNSRVAGQSVLFPEEKDLDALIEYRRALNEPNPIPEDVLYTWAHAMVSQPDYIRNAVQEAGRQLVAYNYNPEGTAEFPEFPGSHAADNANYLPVPQVSGIWEGFKTLRDQRPIRKMYDTRAVDLVQDPNSLEVFGVIAEREGERIAIKANRAVIMCVGGFENNQDMQRNYAGAIKVFPLGTSGNTGDGIKMLQKAGADLWHMRNMQFSSGGIWPAMKFPEYPSAFLRRIPRTMNSFLEIAKDNRRFWNEVTTLGENLHYKVKEHGWWVDTELPFVLPVHMIFDDKARTQGGLTSTPNGMTWNSAVTKYEWSPDSSTEIDRGWIIKAGSIGELAERIGRDATEVKATVAQFNKASAAGSDPDFGRDPGRMSPIDTPPYYAVEIVAGIICTTGGAKRNKESQVLNHDGKPIPRLYEAGELGSTMSNLYQNGSFLTECVVFGRIAGKNAVSEKAWVDARV